MKAHCVSALLWLALVLTVRADGLGDNIPEKVRPIPPPGIQVPQADQQQLKTELEKLQQEIAGLRTKLQSKPDLLELLPDAQIYEKSVRYALEYNEFFNAREIPVAKELLKQGLERASALSGGKAPWTAAS